MDFKERSAKVMKQNEIYSKIVKDLEVALALKSPVMEAENAIDDRTALSLYDCLIPKLKEQRRFRFDKNDKF